MSRAWELLTTPSLMCPWRKPPNVRYLIRMISGCVNCAWEWQLLWEHRGQEDSWEGKEHLWNNCPVLLALPQDCFTPRQPNYCGIAATNTERQRAKELAQSHLKGIAKGEVWGQACPVLNSALLLTKLKPKPLAYSKHILLRFLTLEVRSFKSF